MNSIARDCYMPNSSYYNVRNYVNEFRRIRSGDTFQLYSEPNKRMFEAAQQMTYIILPQPETKKGYTRFKLLKKRDAKKYLEQEGLKKEQEEKDPVHFDVNDIWIQDQQQAT